jgi:hypothetical protein
MKICSVNSLLCTAALAALASACTEVDDRLGASLIPKNQRMEIEVTSPANGVKTYLYRPEGIRSSRTGQAWFGRTVDPDGVFGAQTSGVMLQFRPISYPYEDAEGYGIDPIVDSAVILFSLADVRGDTTQVQHFDVWGIDDSRQAVTLHRDSTYFTNFPVDEIKGQKLFRFSHTGRRGVSARLFPTAAGKEYLNSIVNLPWNEYTDDSLFNKRYRGIYIAPAEDSPAPAALYGTDLSASGISLHVRNHDTLDTSAIYDTLTTYFSFADTRYSYSSDDDGDDKAETTHSWANLSFNTTTFDYTGSTLGTLQTETRGFTDTLPTSPTQPTLYVQSMGGVGAYLRFSDELIDEIRNLRMKEDAGQTVGKDIFINQAMMRVWITDPSSVAGLDASMARLGSYLDIKKLSPIPDYQYEYEVQYNQQLLDRGETANFTLQYGGYLNRSNGYYELDITSYIQGLAKIKEDDPEYRYVAPVIFIAPEAYGVIGAGQSILQGFDSDTPVSIRITYTIIEG